MKRRRFKHLSWDDRLKIESGLKHGDPVQKIADDIGVHRNTIYNEIKRGQYEHLNSDLTTETRYSPEIAEAAYRANLAAKGPDLKIGTDRRLAEHIESRIVNDGYSPAAVLGEIKTQGIEFDTTICEATLYSYIKKGVFLTLEPVSYTHLEGDRLMIQAGAKTYRLTVDRQGHFAKALDMVVRK